MSALVMTKSSVLVTFLVCLSPVLSKSQDSEETKQPWTIGTPHQRIDPDVKIYPETKELLEKLQNVKTTKDVEDLSDDADFELVDLGKPNGPADEKRKYSKPAASCQPSAKKTEANPTETLGKSMPGTETENENAKKITLGESELTITVEDEDKSSGSVSWEVLSSDTKVAENRPLTDPALQGHEESSQQPEGTNPTAENSFISAVEREVLNPTPPALPPSMSDSSKKKKKKKRQIEDPTPTKQELEETYKYEVIPPPDNSPVSMDFPATPAAQGEEHLSKHVPLPLYCDTCMAIAYQLHLSFKKFHDQVRKRPPTESEIYHMVGETCRASRFKEYGMMEVVGQRHITGPGCNKLESEGGIKHSRGPWPKRLSERCEEMTEDIGELTIHSAWMRDRTRPKRLKEFLCFGEPPRNYCQKYGHTDPESAVAEARRKRQREKEQEEDPMDAGRRLAREAAEEAAQKAATDATKDEL